jgi:hypothetical protein
MCDHHHAIRLGSAWDPPAKVPPSMDKHVRWARRFGRPGGLGPDDRVLLVVTESATGAEIAVNGVCLPPLFPPPNLAVVARWSHDITPLLRDRNDIVVAVPATVSGDPVCDTHGRSPLPPAIGTIALEIVTPYKATPGAQVGHPA